MQLMKPLFRSRRTRRTAAARRGPEEPDMLPRTTSCLLGLTAALVLPACAESVGDDADVDFRWGGHHCDDIEQEGLIDADAGFSCDFGIDPNFPPELIAPTIERDRMYMAEKPGLVEGKHLPLAIDFESGAFFSGGRYLFDTKVHAKKYAEFVTEDYVLDGFQFLERPGVLDPECYTWQTIAAYELGDIEADHIIMRTERYAVTSHGNQKHFLESIVPDLLEQATEQGLTGLWLQYNKQEKLVQVVEIAPRVVEPAPGELDVVSFFALATAPSFGEEFEDRGWTKVLDRTHFVLSIWFPFVLGDQGEPSIWPNSPPLPEPYCTDGVCEVSRGENDVTCPFDCPVDCGDAVCQPGEDTHNCPGDCRLE